jgi:hypothetical protein
MTAKTELRKFLETKVAEFVEKGGTVTKLPTPKFALPNQPLLAAVAYRGRKAENLRNMGY